jgi:hypothetical protein
VRIATTIAAAAAAALTISGSLAAQGAPLGGSRAEREVQVTFGFKCGDQFIVRNDTEEAIDLEFQVAGRAARARVHLNARAVLEVKSSADAPLEMLFNGTVIAAAIKGKVMCPIAAP